MSVTFNENGLQIQEFSEIVSDLESSINTLLGTDLDLSSNTIDGQYLGIFSKLNYDMQQFAMLLNTSFDPDYAMGLAMDKILKLNGIRRQEPTKSTVDITLICNTTVTLPSDYKLKDINSQIWVIGEATTLSSGTHSITFKAELWGSVEALANTITGFETIVLGVTSVNNILSATVGIDEETDEEIRIKRNNLLLRNSTSSAGGLKGKLLDVCDYVEVYENKTGTIDANSIPSHSTWVICEGGTLAGIAEIIALENTSGGGYKGAITQTYDELVTRSNNETFIYTHTVKFDRPTVTNIYIKLNVKKKISTSVIDMDLIKTYLATLKYGIGEDINLTELYATIYQAGTGFIASGLQLSKNNSTWVTDVLGGDISERLNIITAQITVTEI